MLDEWSFDWIGNKCDLWTTNYTLYIKRKDRWRWTVSISSLFWLIEHGEKMKGNGQKRDKRNDNNNIRKLLFYVDYPNCRRLEYYVTGVTCSWLFSLSQKTEAHRLSGWIKLQSHNVIISTVIRRYTLSAHRLLGYRLKKRCKLKRNWAVWTNQLQLLVTAINGK